MLHSACRYDQLTSCVSSKKAETHQQGKKRQEKTTPFGVSWMRSPVTYQAAQEHISIVLHPACDLPGFHQGAAVQEQFYVQCIGRVAPLQMQHVTPAALLISFWLSPQRGLQYTHKIGRKQRRAELTSKLIGWFCPTSFCIVWCSWCRASPLGGAWCPDSVC